MLICAAGDIHGAMDHLYRDVLAFEAVLGVRFDCVLHVGDFGIWPDTDRRESLRQREWKRAPRAKSNRGQRYTPHQHAKFPAMILGAPKVSARGRPSRSQMDGITFPVGR